MPDIIASIPGMVAPCKNNIATQPSVSEEKFSTLFWKKIFIAPAMVLPLDSSESLMISTVLFVEDVGSNLSYPF